MAKRFIDSNIFIYVLSKDPRHSAKSLSILINAEKGAYEAYTSTLVISQVLAHLERRRREHAMVKFLEYLGEGYIDIIETSYEDIKGSLMLARKHYLNLSLIHI